MGLQALVGLSNRYGKNPEIVLAGGGNTSYKDARYLYIKASGTTLADITESGFVKMDRARLAQMWETEYPADNDAREAAVLADLMAARVEDPKRPSVETLLHDLFPQAYVVHTHPALVNGLTCSAEGEAAMRRLFGEEAIWVPATMPGYVLAQDVRARIAAYENATGRKADLVFLQNHGIFVAAETPDEVAQKMDAVMSTLRSAVVREPDLAPLAMGPGAAAIAQALSEAVGVGAAAVRMGNNGEIVRRTADADAFGKVNYAFTPDHMVYYKHSPLYLPAGADVAGAVAVFAQQNGFLPKVCAAQGVGVFCLGTDEKDAARVEALFWDTLKIAAYAESFGGGQFMPKWLVDFIANWEVEQYRKQVAK